jgi:hypothetical protein
VVDEHAKLQAVATVNERTSVAVLKLQPCKSAGAKGLAEETKACSKPLRSF